MERRDFNSLKNERPSEEKRFFRSALSRPQSQTCVWGGTKPRFYSSSTPSFTNSSKNSAKQKKDNWSLEPHDRVCTIDHALSRQRGRARAVKESHGGRGDWNDEGRGGWARGGVSLAPSGVGVEVGSASLLRWLCAVQQQPERVPW